MWGSTVPQVQRLVTMWSSTVPQVQHHISSSGHGLGHPPSISGREQPAAGSSNPRVWQPSAGTALRSHSTSTMAMPAVTAMPASSSSLDGRNPAAGWDGCLQPSSLVVGDLWDAAELQQIQHRHPQQHQVAEVPVMELPPLPRLNLGYACDNMTLGRGRRACVTSRYVATCLHGFALVGVCEERAGGRMGRGSMEIWKHAFTMDGAHTCTIRQKLYTFSSAY
jgi:hypothetical protein